ncbi:hypothetical protein BCV70DRAFT_4082 [Testicularia cyperi]|uniref:Uncharacterized protein n=1 Tax=Testicularia cyperi TaxID=1882483 RepID=A0A317XWL5_9BASI|nr:hypothetical protein BCV70DRAFT_4082 [Testicularia cyperi]
MWAACGVGLIRLARTREENWGTLQFLTGPRLPAFSLDSFPFLTLHNAPLPCAMLLGHAVSIFLHRIRASQATSEKRGATEQPSLYAQ